MGNERKGYIWRNLDGDYYYVMSTDNSVEYHKVYAVEGDELFFRDQNGNKVSVPYKGSI